MKYFTINQQVEDEIKIIKKEIFLSMNGVCSEQMEVAGVHHGKNFGVSWVRIKEIAQFHKANLELAERLWFMDFRETKLLACLLTPINDINFEHLNEWVNEIQTVDVAQISAMVLFSKVDFSFNLVLKHINNHNVFVRLTMLHTAARCICNWSNDECTKILQLIDLEKMQNPQLTQGVNAFLENAIMQKPSLTNTVKKHIEILQNNETHCCQYTYNNINLICNGI